jgi:ATP-dependent RNA helicase RhlE
VFTRTKHGADRVVRFLTPAGIPAAAIHGEKSQAQRTAALKGFRDGTVKVLVATDIAARGIDVSGVSHVFNFEIPNVAEQYVHRIGRTARAGADGIAISLIAEDERPYIRGIERLTGVKLSPLPLPADFQKEAARLPAPAKRGNPPTNGGRSQGEGRRDGGRDGGQRREGGRREEGRRNNDRRPMAGRDTPRDGQRSRTQRDGDRARAERREQHGRPRLTTATGASQFDPLRENVDTKARRR